MKLARLAGRTAHVFRILSDLCLALSLTEREMVQSPHIIRDLSLFFFGVCFVYFRAPNLGSL